MTSKVIKANQFQASIIKFSDAIKINKYGGKTVYANYGGSPLRIQMPKMNIPFGVSKYQNPDKPDEIKYSLEMSFANLPEEILSELKKMEDIIIAFAEEKSKELFKKTQSKDLILEFYKSFIKYAESEDGERNDKYAPRLKAKIYTDGKDFRVDAYEAEKVNGSYPKVHITEDNVDEIIQKGGKCEAIIECTGIWVVNKSFGVSWKLAQLKLHRNENQLAGYAFEDDNEDSGTLEQPGFESEALESVLEADFGDLGIHEDSPVKPKRKARESRDL
jgi:hypothetical protein